MQVSCYRQIILRTGISNALGTWEETLIRNDDLRAEIDDMMAEIFGDATLSTNSDPLASSNSENDSDSSSEVEDSDSN